MQFAPQTPLSFAGEGAPVTEVAVFFFPADISSAQRGEFEAGFAKFMATLAEAAEGFKGTCSGWSVEEDVKHAGKTGRAFVAALAWTSVEAHMKYRETDAFKQSVGAVRGLVKAATNTHVVFNDTA